MVGYISPQEPSPGKLGYIASESQRGANAGPGKGDQHGGEDQFAHTTGKICKTCGQTIEPEQAARRRGETEWAHDVCPAVMS
jgi:hypothetical protein